MLTDRILIYKNSWVPVKHCVEHHHLSCEMACNQLNELNRYVVFVFWHNSPAWHCLHHCYSRTVWYFSFILFDLNSVICLFLYWTIYQIVKIKNSISRGKQKRVQDVIKTGGKAQDFPCSWMSLTESLLARLPFHPCLEVEDLTGTPKARTQCNKAASHWNANSMTFVHM
jgi:hypothetical protein